MFELYPVLKFIHIAAVVCWIGGGVLLSLLVEQVRRGGNAAELTSMIDRMEWFGPRYFMPLSFVTLIAGIGLTQIGWSFSQAWVSIGFTGLIVSGAIGGGYLSRKGRTLKALIASKGANSAEAQAAIGQLLMVARIDLLVLTLVVADMVLKPGA